MALPDIREIQKASIQEHPSAPKNEAPGDFFFAGITARPELLPAYGTYARKQRLLQYYRHDYNGLVQSAFAGMTKKWAGIARRIKGKTRRDYFEDVLMRADFGAGFESFIEKVGLDFLTYDDGAYIELIYGGNPLRAPKGPLKGIAALSNLRCLPTGDPQFPVVYWDRKNRKHLLHHSRVIHLVDAPTSDDNFPGYGMSALSRAISLAAQQIHMMRYIEAKLDDKPPPGFVVASNINRGQRDQAMALYNMEQMGDAKPEWGNAAWFFSTDPTAPAKIDFVSFAQAPENWSYKEYMDIHVNALALALGVDVQELWQLTGGTLGSGQQSVVLHAKSQNKTFAAFLNQFQPKLNDALPRFADFEFVIRDPYAIQDEALASQGWAGALSTIGKEVLSPDEKRLIFANMIPAVRDVIGTRDGGVTPAPVVEMEPEAEGVSPSNAGPRADSENPRRLAKPERTLGERSPGTVRKEVEEADVSLKETSETGEVEDAKAEPETEQQAFEREFRQLLDNVAAGTLTEAALRILLRDLLQRYGLRAYRQALRTLERPELISNEDNRALILLLAALAPFVTNFAAEVFSGSVETLAERALGLKERAGLWFSQGVMPFEYEALYRNAPDKRFTWRIGATEQSCETCLEMNGKSRPMWWYKASGIVPQAQTLACHGFRCDCRLEPA